MSKDSLSFLASLRARLSRRLLRSRPGSAPSHVSVDDGPLEEEPKVPAALETRAAGMVREYLRAQAANLERAERLGERAERLEKAGIPSESARNRAERAKEEVMVGLAALRGRFVEAAGGREGGRAFDRVVDLLCPTFKPLY